MADPYASLSGGGGKLKLKGVKDSKVDKKKKKKRTSEDPDKADNGTPNSSFKDNSVVLRRLSTEEGQSTVGSHRETSPVKTQKVESGPDSEKQEDYRYLKTEAERRYEEQRRKRLEDRLKKEGVKTHKQRVEELNRYLSGLSEHHDMPKIGPG